MRLIDADTLRKDVEKDRDANDMPKMWYQGVEYAINHIIHAPTVDGVKHGHWIEVQRIHEKDHTAICECSLCGDTVWVYDGQRAWNYCPNCGAEMDEVKVNNSKGLDFWMTKEQFNEIYEVENETD